MANAEPTTNMDFDLTPTMVLHMQEHWFDRRVVLFRENPNYYWGDLIEAMLVFQQTKALVRDMTKWIAVKPKLLDAGVGMWGELIVKEMNDGKGIRQTLRECGIAQP